MVCLKHTDTEAVTRCAACGKPLCERCRMTADGADYCSEECHRRGVASGARSGDVLVRKESADRKALLRKVIYLLIVLILALIAGMLYMENKKTLDRKISDSVRVLEKKTSEGVDSVRKSLPGDSKYKKDRESLVK